MSKPATKAWTWDVSNLENMTSKEIKILLQNRNFNDWSKDANELLEILKNEYEIDDANINFDELTKKEIKPELKLRWLSTDDGDNKTLVDRLKVHDFTSTDKLLTFGYVREYEKEFKLYNIPDYLKRIVLSYGISVLMAFYLGAKHSNHVFTLNIKTKQKSKLNVIGEDVSFEECGINHAVTAKLPQSLKESANELRE